MFSKRHLQKKTQISVMARVCWTTRPGCTHSGSYFCLPCLGDCGCGQGAPRSEEEKRPWCGVPGGGGPSQKHSKEGRPWVALLLARLVCWVGQRYAKVCRASTAIGYLVDRLQFCRPLQHLWEHCGSPQLFKTWAAS